MKKTLAIVLALVMVLAMIPAMGAAVTENKTITDKQYDLKVQGWNDADAAATAQDVNTITYSYDFEEATSDVTGKWTEDAKMAIVTVGGFDLDFTADAEVYIDGKKLTVDSWAEYEALASQIGIFGTSTLNARTVSFPVELTKAGYTDTFLVQVTETKDGKTVSETAKISIVLKNKASYKDVETAVITNIATTDNEILNTYIVGDKIYLDYVAGAVEASDLVKITFAKANGAAFSEITYANHVLDDDGAWAALQVPTETKLDTSAVKYDIKLANSMDDIIFELETKNAFYQTKEYDVVVRTGIVEEDPKGIYFVETAKTIKIGEKYAPVVMGVKTGKAVAAELRYGDNTSKEVIDVEDGATVIGVKEGVAYISASYKAAGQATTYTASSMKIIVTLPAVDETVPEVETAETYYVTCRALNVRAGAGTSYKKVDLIKRGAAVKVVELKNGWAKLDDGTYVCAKYIAK